MRDEKVDWWRRFRGDLRWIDFFELAYSPTHNELRNSKMCGGECHSRCLFKRVAVE